MIGRTTVRIYGAFGQDPRELMGPGRSDRTAKASGPGKGKASSADKAEGADGASLVQALSGEEINAKAVAEARRLLMEGKLDTPEACAKAAETIIDRGL